MNLNLLLNKYFWTDLWYTQVSSRIKPRQRWLTKQIPRTWLDADSVIELCVFESLIYWWTQDGGEEMSRFQFENDDEFCTEERKNERKEVYDRLLAAYNWATSGRKNAMADYENLLNTFSRSDFLDRKFDRELFNEINRLETKCIESDTFYLKEIIELRKYMWT